MSIFYESLVKPPPGRTYWGGGGTILMWRCGAGAAAAFGSHYSLRFAKSLFFPVTGFSPGRYRLREDPAAIPAFLVHIPLFLFHRPEVALLPRRGQ
jgi:hypothetical protein